MSVEPASPITTYFRVCDGVRVRYVDTKADSDTIVLMLAPWPESLWAFRFRAAGCRTAGASSGRRVHAANARDNT